MRAIIPDQMSLSITRPANSSVDYVQILGDVDLSNSDALAAAARRIIDDGGDSICVDLGGITFMDSTLVEFLLHVRASEGRSPRHLVLCRPRPMARRVIEVTGLEDLATVQSDLPALWPRALTAS
jgi:anti-sigma B factor antagonist